MRFNRDTFHAKIRSTIAVPGFGVLESQKEGLNRLLGFIEDDNRFGEMDADVAIAIIAYFLATVAHECTILTRIGSKHIYVKSFAPQHEMGGNAYLNAKYDTRVDLGNTRARDGDGARNAGDGYVQNTGGANARKTGRLLAGAVISYDDIPPEQHDLLAAFAHEGGSQRTPVTIDGNTFIRQHTLLRVPRISYLDAIDGMLSGRFTGRKIGDYINEDESDFFNARRVINGITTKNRPTVLDMQRMAYAFETALHASLQPDEIAGSELAESSVSADVPTTSDDVSLPVVLPVEKGDDDASPVQDDAAAPFTAMIPNIDGAKGWIKSGVGGGFLATAWAFVTNQPPEIKLAFLGLLALLITGAVVIFIKFHKQIFAYVTHFNTLAVETGTPIALVTHK